MSWLYRRMVTVYSDTNDVQIDYPVKLIISRSESQHEPGSGSNTLEIPYSKVRSDFRDIRFVINNRIVPHYDHTGSGNIREFYIKIPRLLPDIGTDVYVYYGNEYMIVDNSSASDSITYLNHLIHNKLNGVSITGSHIWSDFERDHLCPVLQYDASSNYGKLSTQGVFNRPVMNHTIEMEVAFGTGGNGTVLLFNGNNDIVEIRRSASSSDKIIAAYNMDTIYEIGDINTNFNKYGFHFYNNIVYYSFNGVVYGQHAVPNHNTYIAMASNSTYSTATVAPDYIMVRKSAWSGLGELIHYGDWSTEEYGGFWCLSYDNTFNDLKMYIDFRGRIGDSVQHPSNISVPENILYTDNRFDILNESIVIDEDSITSDGSYDFLHKLPCQSTVFFWIKPTLSGSIINTGKYSIIVNSDMELSLNIANVCNGTFSNTLIQDEWNVVCITFNNDISSDNAVCYTSTLSSDILISKLNKTGSAPSTESHSICDIGNSVTLSELMIFNNVLSEEQCKSIINRTKNGYIYPVMNNTRYII